MAVIKVAEALNITVEPEDIEISHKLKNGKGIIVKFHSHKVKSFKLYKERTNLKDVKISDVFPSYPAHGQQRRIFINENLTAYRRRLVEAANKRRRDGLFGHSMVRFMLNTKARYIRKSSVGRSRLICQSPLKCAGQIQNGGRFEFKKGKL